MFSCYIRNKVFISIEFIDSNDYSKGSEAIKRASYKRAFSDVTIFVPITSHSESIPPNSRQHAEKEKDFEVNNIPI